MSKYYKILPEDLKCRGFQYHEGLNIDTNIIDAKKCSYGLHFADAEHILSFYDYGTIIAEVEIPEGAVVYHFGTKSKADKIILKNLRPLWSVDTIKALIQEGVDVESYKDYMLCEAARNGDLDTIKYLTEHGANTHAWDNSAFGYAARKGYLDIIKYLVEHGADIHADDDFALRTASCYGQLEVVKYLVEQGTDIHANNDDALCWSSVYGYFDVVKYLVKHGANIHAQEDFAIRWAKTPEIEDYLKSIK